MDDRIRELLAGAAEVVPAQEANEAIARNRGGGDAPGLRSYELVLESWQKLVEQQVPKLVYHLESVGAFLPECRGVVIAAFAGERLHFFPAADFAAALCRMMDLTPAQLSQRHGTHESRVAQRGPPLLLPGSKP